VTDTAELDLSPASDPFARFSAWLAEAGTSEPNDPNAMALATADGSGSPSLRMVLLKGHDERGFVFYTNFESRKGTDLPANPRAALLFHCKSLRRQVRIEGPVEVVSDQEADAYYSSRPRDSRIGAWASRQSRPLESRFALETEVAKVAARYPLGAIPRPPFWSGFRVRPLRIEFWQDRPFRLHDRLVYHRDSLEAPSWATEKLYP